MRSPGATAGLADGKPDRENDNDRDKSWQPPESRVVEKSGDHGYDYAIQHRRILSRRAAASCWDLPRSLPRTPSICFGRSSRTAINRDRAGADPRSSQKKAISPALLPCARRKSRLLALRQMAPPRSRARSANRAARFVDDELSRARLARMTRARQRRNPAYNQPPAMPTRGLWRRRSVIA